MTNLLSPVAVQRRYGRFFFSARFAHAYSTELLRVMGKCAIFRAEHLFDSDRIEYWAACDQFRNLSEGERMPLYEWHFLEDGSFQCVEVTA